MTSPRRFESDLPALLADLYLAGTPDYRDDLVQQIARVRQRPAWTFAERWLPVEIVTSRAPIARVPWRQLGVLALIAVLLAAALAVYVGSRQTRLPAPFGPAANGFIPFAKTGDIYVGDPVTGASRLLVGGPEADQSPVTSPDGTRIVFNRKVGSGTDPDTDRFDTYVMNADGSGLARVEFEPIAGSSRLAWTPDSRRLAIIQQVGPAGCQTSTCRVGKLDIVDASSGETRTIATADGLDFVQFRPPDGNDLLYRALVDGQWGLFAMDIDGNHVRAVVPATVPGEMDASFANASYSADGNRVFYDSYTADADFGNPGCCQLFVVDADGSNLHKFVSSTVGTWDGVATVSPDGTMVAFWHNLPNRSNRVTVIRADGTGQLTLTGPELSGGAHWIWAPDSSKILMFPNNIDTGQAFLLDPAGGPWTSIPWSSTGDLDWQRLALTS